jgi:putative DNA primase/helicase
MAIAKAPDWLLDLVIPTSSLPTAEVQVEVLPKNLRRITAYVEVARERELERLQRAPNHQRNDCLNRCAFKLGQLLPYGTLDERDCTSKLSEVARRIGLDEAEILPTIRSGLAAGRQNPRHLNVLKGKIGNDAIVIVGAKTVDLTAELSRLRENDTDNAQRFASRNSNRILYTPGKGWLVFDGKRWEPDSFLQCMELAKDTARLIADEVRYLPDEHAKAAPRSSPITHCREAPWSA